MISIVKNLIFHPFYYRQVFQYLYINFKLAFVFFKTEMADADPQFKRLLLPAEETLFEQLLRFGLYLGAAFQIMCLLAIVIYQSGPSDSVASLKV